MHNNDMLHNENKMSEMKQKKIKRNKKKIQKIQTARTRCECEQSRDVVRQFINLENIQ